MIEERIAEMPIFEWTGCRLKVTVELPWQRQSQTSQMYLDTNDVEALKILNTPPPNTDNSAELFIWQDNQERANRVVDMIAGKVARHLCLSAISDARDYP